MEHTGVSVELVARSPPEGIPAGGVRPYNPAVDVDEAVERVRRACLALPEVEERLSHGAPTFFVRGKRSFLMLWPDGHHGSTFPHLWCAAAPEVQRELVESEPDRFFRPPYVGHRGWVGMRLDRDCDADELAELCADAYRAVAPPRLLRVLDDGTAP